MERFRCVFTDCLCHEVRDSSKVTLFKFPNDVKVRQQWNNVVGSNVVGWLGCVNSSRVCQFHFSPSDFKNFAQVQSKYAERLVLKPDAIPSGTCCAMTAFESQPQITTVSTASNVASNKCEISTQCNMDFLQENPSVKTQTDETNTKERGIVFLLCFTKCVDKM